MIWQCRQAMLRFLKAEDGPTAVEYAVMLALIIVVCVAAVTALGQKTNKMYENTVLSSGFGS